MLVRQKLVVCGVVILILSQEIKSREKSGRVGEDRITAGPGWTGSQKADRGWVPGGGVGCVWSRLWKQPCWADAS